MHRTWRIIFVAVLFVSCSNQDNEISLHEPDTSPGILFATVFSGVKDVNSFSGIDNSNNYISSAGLVLCDSSKPVELLRNYSLADRSIEIRCLFHSNSVLQFTHSFSGIVFQLDIEQKLLYVDGKSFLVDFLKGNGEYVITFRKHYQKQSICIKDYQSGEERLFSFVNDGQGGVGKGSVNNNPSIFEMPHGYLSLSCLTGEIICKSIEVSTPQKRIKLLLYGDSITETEVYYPCSSFSQSWPQLLCGTISDCLVSGFSGRSITDIVPIIKDELPYLDVDYVMITIGTNGGNTIENLSELVEYLLDMGVKPILNHIPCNESNTQVGVNEIIDLVRQKYSIKGADFDKATVDEYGNVNKTKMFWEDYGPDYIELKHDYWHHPNPKGSEAMFKQIKEDVPELFE